MVVLRYLIAVENQLAGSESEVTEVGYDGPRPKRGPAVRYGNLFDQTGTGKYGPYLKGTDTADQYGERVVDPHGAGWNKLLTDQCVAATAAGFDTIEWDNPDGYDQEAVLNAVQFAFARDLKVLAKNPLICDWNTIPYVGHPGVIGVIVEKDDDATPQAYDALRRQANRPELPIWFVAFDGGKAWAETTAKAAAKYSNMWVTYSPDGEYTSSVDVSMSTAPVAPLPNAPPAPLVPSSPDYFARCVKLLLVHEGGNDDDPRDPGGRTSRGIIQSEYDVWRRDHPGLPADVWQAPQQTVLDIYRAKYWNVMRCDDLPPGVDYIVFDYGVNSGVSRGIRQLQTSLGIAVDGAMGPLTIAAAKTVEPLSFINKYQDARLHFLQGLGTWSVFGRGWGTRVATVRRDALQMVSGGADVPAVPEPPVIIHDALWIQQSLNKLGASPPLREDGNIGPVSRAAIAKFQASQGLIADGLPGPLTIGRMVQALNVPVPPPAVDVPPVQPPVSASLLIRVIAGMTALGYPIDTGPGEVNIAYAEGHNRQSAGGGRNDNKPGYWNDVRMAFTYDGGQPRLLGEWTATTQPGPYFTQTPLNPKGAANIYPGSYKAWKIGLHRGAYEALVQRGNIKLTRDKNKDYSREGDVVEVGDYEGVNQHHGGNASEVGGHSAGCLVGARIDGHESFMSYCRGDPRWQKDRNFLFRTAILSQSQVP